MKPNLNGRVHAHLRKDTNKMNSTSNFLFARATLTSFWRTIIRLVAIVSVTCCQVATDLSLVFLNTSRSIANYIFISTSLQNKW